MLRENQQRKQSKVNPLGRFFARSLKMSLKGNFSLKVKKNLRQNSGIFAIAIQFAFGSIICDFSCSFNENSRDTCNKQLTS